MEILIGALVGLAIVIVIFFIVKSRADKKHREALEARARAITTEQLKRNAIAEREFAKRTVTKVEVKKSSAEPYKTIFEAPSRREHQQPAYVPPVASYEPRRNVYNHTTVVDNGSSNFLLGMVVGESMAENHSQQYDNDVVDTGNTYNTYNSYSDSGSSSSSYDSGSSSYDSGSSSSSFDSGSSGSFDSGSSYDSGSSFSGGDSGSF